MQLIINKLGNNKTVDFAVNELLHYMFNMNPDIEVVIKNNLSEPDKYFSVGLCECYDEYLPDVEDKELDDAIYINVENGRGIITGTNPRSVLIAVYRYLKELGCAFIRPGRDGEIIPECDFAQKKVYVSDKASYRHREVCIEGAPSYEHISDMLDWIPKIGMNGYYMQFVKPYGFFKQWYNHTGNPYMEAEEKSREELDEIINKLEDQISVRDLIYLTVGHSWNSEMFGVDTTYWETEPEPSEEIRKYLAEIGGKRGWRNGMPLGTNLCYSNPEVRELMTDYAVEYCRTHPQAKYIVFWLADGFANYCECDECKKHRIADLYIKLLNRLDEKLTEAKIDTKVVFSIQYNWPEKEKINNPDRFVMMVYPIYKNYAHPFPSEIDESSLPELPVYDNNTIFPRYFKTVEDYIAIWEKWKDAFDGDTVVYDYQLIWLIYHDPGFMFSAEVTYENMKNLEVVGINGMNSCQVQRVCFPSAFPMITMAETLWNRNVDYNKLKHNYFKIAFGSDGDELADLLEKVGQPELTRLEPSVDASAWQKTMGKRTTDPIDRSYGEIEKIKALVEKNVSDTSHPAAVLQSWKYMAYYPKYAELYLNVLRASYGECNVEKTKESYAQLVDYVNKSEPELHRVFDGFMLQSRLNYFFKSMKEPELMPGINDD